MRNNRTQQLYYGFVRFAHTHSSFDGHTHTLLLFLSLFYLPIFFPSVCSKKIYTLSSNSVLYKAVQILQLPPPPPPETLFPATPGSSLRFSCTPAFSLPFLADLGVCVSTFTYCTFPSSHILFENPFQILPFHFPLQPL